MKYVQYIPKNKYGSVDEAILSLKLQQLQKFIDKESREHQENGESVEKRAQQPDLLKRQTQKCRSNHQHFRNCPARKHMDVSRLQQDAFKFLLVQKPELAPVIPEKGAHPSASFFPDAKLPLELERMLDDAKACKKLLAQAEVSSLKYGPKATSPVKGAVIESYTGKQSVASRVSPLQSKYEPVVQAEPLPPEFVVGVGETYDLPPTERGLKVADTFLNELVQQETQKLAPSKQLSPNNADLTQVSPQGLAPSRGFFQPGVQILNRNLVSSPVDAQTIKLPKQGKRGWRNSAVQAKMRAVESAQKQSDPLQAYCGEEIQGLPHKLATS